jgi:hypothetical protein
MANEKRLIDANELVYAIHQSDDRLNSSIWETDEIVDEIIRAYTVDAVEVVHGHNTYDHDSAFECSVCGWSDWDTLTGDGKYNYCPNCGAKMDGDGNA